MPGVGKREGMAPRGHKMRNFLIACCVVILVVCGGSLKVEKLKANRFEVQNIELSAPGIMPYSNKK